MRSVDLFTDEYAIRATDNQIYVAVCSPARDLTAAYHAVSGVHECDACVCLVFAIVGSFFLGRPNVRKIHPPKVLLSLTN
jgi:hypothetical protein